MERAIDRHGGWAAWDRFGGVRVVVKSFNGIVGKLKGVGRTFTLPLVFEVDPKAQRTAFPDYPKPGWRTEYAEGTVSVVPGNDRGEAVRHESYRRSFDGLFRKLRKWSDLDIAYFVGYSMPNYHGYPFALSSLGFVRHRRYGGEGGTWSAITLDYPEGFDCHSRRQTFHFDPTGLLRRVDYWAEVVGPGPTAAHHYEDYVSVEGLLFPRRRRVLGRVFGLLTGMNLLTVGLELSPLPAARSTEGATSHA